MNCGTMDLEFESASTPEPQELLAPKGGQAILPLFNGKVDAYDAFQWNKDKILRFFDEVVDKPGPRGYNVESSAQKSLTVVVKKIKDMVGPKDPQVFLDSQLGVTYHGHTTYLETIFDLVGWIFSVTGTSPSNANKNNYYYPLGALYCIFWRRLTEIKTSNLEELARPTNLFMHDPQMVQMTWFEKKSGKTWTTYIGISATLDGQGLAPKKNVARGRREDQMIESRLLPKDHKGKTYVQSPNPQKFGHCAETTPFLYLFQILSDVNKNTAMGYALQAKLILPDKPGASYTYARPDYRVLADPCANCTYLIKSCLKLNIKNFLAPTTNNFQALVVDLTDDQNQELGVEENVDHEVEVDEGEDVGEDKETVEKDENIA